MGLYLIIVVPALNESQTISEVIRRIPRSIPGVERVDVLVVDDGSSDGTADCAVASGAFLFRSVSGGATLVWTFRGRLFWFGGL